MALWRDKRQKVGMESSHLGPVGRLRPRSGIGLNSILSVWDMLVVLVSSLLHTFINME